ncbi:MAG: nucleotidyltransferase [Bacteroidetes bacterium]|nr:nucleotidyltransferase [Bacteroidota bacterium]MDA1120347.1 nucleotidyltransferase [Bacteroidota bacterium]
MLNPSLVVMAAGLGSRYGSLKQMDQFGSNGESIVDYIIYDAIAAGFQKIVFVIRKSIGEEFRSIYHNKLSSRADIHYVFQEIDRLPKPLEVPSGRKRPWGTGHAVWMAESVVDGPFGVVNADDFYGRKSLTLLFHELRGMNNESLSGCIIGYNLRNTLSDFGSVSRAICDVSSDGFLRNITERTKIVNNKGQIGYIEDDNLNPLTGQELVSLNLMGLSSPAFKLIREGFTDFYNHLPDPMSSEFYIPTVFDLMIKKGINIPVIKTTDTWFGITYKEDKPVVHMKIQALINEGVYPEKLWESIR